MKVLNRILFIMYENKTNIFHLEGDIVYYHSIHLNSIRLQVLKYIISMEHCFLISDTQQGYPQPSAPVAYPYPPPPYSSGQQVFSYNG